jgi:hypothetical protein
VLGLEHEEDYPHRAPLHGRTVEMRDVDLAVCSQGINGRLYLHTGLED